MAEPILPTTQKGQIDALISALGVSDFAAAIEIIPTLLTSSKSAGQWADERQALFAALGGKGDVPEHYDFEAGITVMKADQRTLFEKLGVNDQAGAILALDNLRTQNNNLQAVQTSIFGALKATDHAGAMRAITDIDGRIEAGVQAGVIARAASAGLTAPVEKKPGDTTTNGSANVVTRAEWGTMNSKQQLEFSKAGGKIVDEQAA